MRLIDADNLKAYLREYLNYDHAVPWVDAQPTAYDVNAVMERLDKASDYYECEEQGREHVQMVDLREAIEIVKAGGIDG